MLSETDSDILDPHVQNQIKAYTFLKSAIKLFSGTALFFLLAVQGLQRISYYLTVPTYISSRYYLHVITILFYFTSNHSSLNILLRLCTCKKGNIKSFSPSMAKANEARPTV